VRRLIVKQFLVDKEGNVMDPFILRGIGYGADVKWPLMP